MITIIAAMSDDFVIGVNNGLPWDIKGDMKFFKDMTTKQTVVMGYNTYKSIGKALPRRTNIVVTKSHGNAVKDALVASYIPIPNDDHEYIIMGGAQIYKKYFPIADRLLLTRVYTTIDDIFATRLEGYNPVEWVKTRNIADNEENGLIYNISEYKRK